MAFPQNLQPRGAEVTLHGVALALYAGDPAFAFEVERAPDSGGSPDTGASVFFTADPGSISFVDVLPPTLDIYHYRVRHALEGYDGGPWTAWLAVIAAELPATLPAKPPGTGTTWVIPTFQAWVATNVEGVDPPSGLIVNEGVTQNTADLNWTDNATGETGYEVQRAPDASGSPGSWSVIATLAADVSSYSDTDGSLTPDAVYWYRVRALDIYGGSAFAGPVSVDFGESA